MGKRVKKICEECGKEIVRFRRYKFRKICFNCWRKKTHIIMVPIRITKTIKYPYNLMRVWK